MRDHGRAAVAPPLRGERRTAVRLPGADRARAARRHERPASRARRAAFPARSPPARLLAELRGGVRAVEALRQRALRARGSQGRPGGVDVAQLPTVRGRTVRRAAPRRRRRQHQPALRRARAGRATRGLGRRDAGDPGPVAAAAEGGACGDVRAASDRGRRHQRARLAGAAARAPGPMAIGPRARSSQAGLLPLRGPRAEGLAEPAGRGAAPRRHRIAAVHGRHYGHAEGGDADPPQPRRQCLAGRRLDAARGQPARGVPGGAALLPRLRAHHHAAVRRRGGGRDRAASAAAPGRRRARRASAASTSASSWACPRSTPRCSSTATRANTRSAAASSASAARRRCRASCRGSSRRSPAAGSSRATVSPRRRRSRTARRSSASAATAASACRSRARRPGSSTSRRARRCRRDTTARSRSAARR